MALGAHREPEADVGVLLNQPHEHISVAGVVQKRTAVLHMHALHSQGLQLDAIMGRNTPGAAPLPICLVRSVAGQNSLAGHLDDGETATQGRRMRKDNDRSLPCSAEGVLEPGQLLIINVYLVRTGTMHTAAHCAFQIHAQQWIEPHLKAEALQQTH